MSNIFPFPGRDILLPHIEQAKNCTLTDSEGNTYIDLESGVWCTGIGHTNPAVTKAMAEQMDKISHVGFCYEAPVVNRAAGAVLNLLDHVGGRCTFLCSGSEAVEYGIRVIRALFESRKIMTMSDSYLGAYGDAARKHADEWYLFDWNECERCGLEACSDECPRYSSIPFDDLCAFLFEPGSASGLVRFPPAKLIDRIARDISDSGGAIMVNEVTTGMGRTGKWFGFQHYEIKPDIVAMGKGIGNGYPVSATSLNSHIIELLDGEPIPYGQSHINDPLGAAVAEAVINTISQNDLIRRAEDLSALLIPGLRQIASESELIKSVRGKGLMAVLVMADHLDLSTVSALHRRLFENGFIVDHRPGKHVLRMDPALTIDTEDIHSFLEILRSSLKTLESEL